MNEVAPDVVALGGGHGLAVTLRALRQLQIEPVAIVGTGDDGGSSGRLRAHLGVPPPGDLRMALAALAADPHRQGDRQGLWLRVLQHRFGGSGDVEGHALGNLLLVALWEETGDVVRGLDRLGSLLEARGRVLPNCLEPVEVSADVVDSAGNTERVHGQARLTNTRGHVTALRLEPPNPAVCAEAVAALAQAKVIILGPGSWFTSVLVHLRVPEIVAEFRRSDARRVLVLNAGPQQGETEGFSAADHLESWARLLPDVALDAVLADPAAVDDPAALERAAAAVGAAVHFAPLLSGPGVHDPSHLATALSGFLEGVRPVS